MIPAKWILIPLSGILVLASCVRPDPRMLRNGAEAEHTFYRRINLNRLTCEEKAFIAYFHTLDDEERHRILTYEDVNEEIERMTGTKKFLDATIRTQRFVDRNQPSERDLVFVYHFGRFLINRLHEPMYCLPYDVSTHSNKHSKR